MEAIPKLPMLYFEPKVSPAEPDLEGPMKKIIAHYYQENPEEYNVEIRELEALRKSACRATRDLTGCSLLKRYYAQISSLENRFQILKANLDVQFAWLNVYTEETVYGDIHFELASVLYNIGALHAELGALDLRMNDQSMKTACRHFQCASWAFEQIRDNPAGNKSKDLSHDLLSFLARVMIAQAQECILEKSMLDNKQSSITAKIAAQVCEYYNNSLLMLIQASLNDSYGSIVDVVGSKLFKEWKKFVELKISYYNAVCNLFMGMSCEDQQKMGERLTWFKTADEKVKDCAKIAKEIDKRDVVESITFLTDYLRGKLDNAQKENDMVYHEIVPTNDKLVAVKGVSLVKPIAFTISDPDICGSDIFRKLVPIECHETASIYTEEKDQLMRSVRQKIASKNEALETYMSSLQLRKDTIRPKVSDVPDELIEICAAMSTRDNPVEIIEKLLSNLDSVSNEVGSILKQCRDKILKDESEEKNHKALFGKPSTRVLTELESELKKHEDAHMKATKSNALVKHNFKRHVDDMHVISDSTGKSLNNVLPTATDIQVDSSILSELEKLVSKVDEMKGQRSVLENQLRESILKDDVLAKVVSHSKGDLDEIFDSELKKFEKHVSLIDQNLAAQENILKALTKANARYAETRKAVKQREKERQERVQQLIVAYEVYQDILDNAEKALQFYPKFKVMIEKTASEISSAIRHRQEEREKATAYKPVSNPGYMSNYHPVGQRPNQARTYVAPSAPSHHMPNQPMSNPYIPTSNYVPAHPPSMHQVPMHAVPTHPYPAHQVPSHPYQPQPVPSHHYPAPVSSHPMAVPSNHGQPMKSFDLLDDLPGDEMQFLGSHSLLQPTQVSSAFNPPDENRP
ncbi:Tyrosine-protein phosphatase non-receptor type 23 [Halotydeus destructor]|nr:Tyrosine-protein phosphatase non-receptor type 23 [Halotydeus destructor]